MGLFGRSESETKRLILVNEKAEKVNEIFVEVNEIREQLSQIRSRQKDITRDKSASDALKWDYRTADDLTDDQVNDWGLDGWEMVGLTSYTTGRELGGSGVWKVHFRYAFKRPIIMPNDPESDSLRAKEQDLIVKETNAISRYSTAKSNYEAAKVEKK